MIDASFAPLLIYALLQPAPQPPASVERRPLTLTGCTAPDAVTPSQFTLYDPHRGMMYRLTEKRVGTSYLGRRVQVFGALLPTTNIAAQAGDIDPVITTMAFTRLNLSGTTPFNRPKAHVETIRGVPGGCPP